MSKTLKFLLVLICLILLLLLLLLVLIVRDGGLKALLPSGATLNQSKSTVPTDEPTLYFAHNSLTRKLRIDAFEGSMDVVRTEVDFVSALGAQRYSAVVFDKKSLEKVDAVLVYDLYKDEVLITAVDTSVHLIHDKINEGARLRLRGVTPNPVKERMRYDGEDYDTVVLSGILGTRDGRRRAMFSDFSYDSAESIINTINDNLP